MRVSRREIYAWEGESGRVSARTILRRAGRPATGPAVAALLNEKERRFARMARRVSVDPRFRRTLRRLARRGVPLALVTGTSSREVRRILPATVLQAFQAVVTGDRIRHGKPHPEPYRRAMRALGMPPARTIVVENAPYGIRSAQRAGAGLVVALASSLPARFLREADRTLRSSADAARLLERLTVPD